MQFINKTPWLVLLLGLFCHALQTTAQSHPMNYASQEVLVQMAPSAVPQDVITLLPGWKIQRQVSEVLNVWLLSDFNTPEIEHNVFKHLQTLRKHPLVVQAQVNHWVEERHIVLPNDPELPQQWHLNNTGQSNGTVGADIGADAAWNVSTGGLTPDGDTIVIAVIDGALHINHADWGNNLWINYAEIDNDNLDNDGNGYTDDYRGWNAILNNDDINNYSSTSHGTSVSGLVAAKGNNGTGVSGINWNTKLMFVAATGAGGGTEADILAAYDYVLKARKTYNATHGQSGAFVVAVNCSFGFDATQAYESPLWCAMLDTLGHHGIITVGATANDPVDVEVVGDVPTTCPSNYMLAVTSLDHNNQKALNAAYGATSIDLGAYGVNVVTLKTGSTWYGTANGTSFAAPQVSGAIGLLYSAPCPNLIALSKANPAAGAAWVRDLILESVQPTPALEGITATGGRLHIGNMMAHYQAQCSECPVPYWLDATTIDSNAVQLSWIETITTEAVDLRWKAMGSTTWQTIYDVHSPIVLTNLNGCQSYQFMVSAQCANAQNSAWSAPLNFTTDGCCVAPELEITQVGDTYVDLQWVNVTAASDYSLLYRQAGSSVWSTTNIGFSNMFTLNGLSGCTDWEIAVRTRCGSEYSVQGPTLSFSTTSCGACLDADYCHVEANSADDEWIAKVEIDNWSHSSEGGAGYEDLSSADPANLLALYPGQSCLAAVTPGFSASAFTETFRIYVDFNGDGDFLDNGELAFDPGYGSNSIILGTFSAPNFTYEGLSRMRVMMRFSNNGTHFPQPCTNFDYGQVEDYCVWLVTAVSATSQQSPAHDALKLTPQPATDWVQVTLPAQESATEMVRYTLTDMEGKHINNNTAILSELAFTLRELGVLPSGIYMLRVQGEQGVYCEKLIKQ
jgi:serine protease